VFAADVARDFGIIIVITHAVLIATATAINAMVDALLVKTESGMFIAIRFAIHTAIVVIEIPDSVLIVKLAYGVNFATRLVIHLV
jgi:hypothetical protein